MHSVAEKVLNETGKVTVKGGEVFYKKVFTENSRGNIPLLILHGGPTVPHVYLENLASLATERPVIFYDQLGCGESDKPEDDNLWHLPRFVEEVEHVRNALGLEKVHLFGHSWGAALALEHTLKKSSGIMSLTLASPLISAAKSAEDSVELVKIMPEQFRNVIFESEKNGNLTSPEYYAARTAYGREYLCRLDTLPDAIISGLKSANEKLRRILWGSGPRHPDGRISAFDKSSELKNLSLPVLITCGRHDAPRPTTLEIYRQQIPNAQLEIFEKSSHMSHLEEPERYLHVLRHFLAQCL